MSERRDTTGTGGEKSTSANAFVGYRCSNGHLIYPHHTVCPECDDREFESIDLMEYDGKVLTWTTSTATPIGVREPNTIAVVELDVSGTPLRVLGGMEDDSVAIGDEVTPAYIAELRNPDNCIRERGSQRWDGVRFKQK